MNFDSITTFQIEKSRYRQNFTTDGIDYCYSHNELVPLEKQTAIDLWPNSWRLTNEVAEATAHTQYDPLLPITLYLQPDLTVEQ